jgi:hypothetical protein
MKLHRHAYGVAACLLGVSFAHAEEAQNTSVEQPTVIAAELCSLDQINPLYGFVEQDAGAFLDMPDADLVRATSPVERQLTARLVQNEIQALLTKAYCEIGLTQMIVDYHHRVEDDAISAITIRTIYRWAAEADYPGWQIERLGEHQHCARGQDQETNLCL